MKFEWIKTPQIIKKIFSKYHWDVPNKNKAVYLTFDDGPIPEVTPWVLSQLEMHQSKATFFCIGDNIKKHPDIFKQIIEKGHTVGNHTHHHINGWDTSIKTYIENTERCQQSIEEILKAPSTKFFRPPYGKICPRQSKALRKKGYKIMMWDVLSADYDSTLTKEQCLENVVSHIESGSIIVFHDSLKAFPHLEYVLPKVLQFLEKKNYRPEMLG